MSEANGSQRIKVAIVIMHFNYGGAERMVALLASRLDLLKYDVRVFCIYGDPQDNVMERMILAHGVSITYIRKGLGFSFRYLVKVWRELSRFKPDIVHTHLNACMYCAPWVLFHNSKMLHTLHSVPEKEAGKFRRKVMKRLYKRHKATPVAISEENRLLTSRFYGLPLSAVEMVVNPVDVASFKGDSPKPWCCRAYDFVHVARFEPEKNHKGLIEAFSRLVNGNEQYANVNLALVGQGSLEPEVHDQVVAANLENNVHFLGLRDDIADLMHDSKCFVLPSDYEGLPMTILEAMAAGLPVIATHVGGVPDVVEDGANGFLVEPGDTAELARVMGRVLEEEELLCEMSRRAYNTALRFDCNCVAESYGLLYEWYKSR